jgi:hypothetical protein
MTRALFEDAAGRAAGVEVLRDFPGLVLHLRW